MQVPVVLTSQAAQLPTKARHDAGWDLYSTQTIIIAPQGRALVPTGVQMAIPEDHVGLIWPRSGLSYKKGIDVLAGVIDSCYRGDIGVILYNTSHEEVEITAGDRVAQILIQPVPDTELVACESLPTTSRGDGGFGSTGE